MLLSGRGGTSQGPTPCHKPTSEMELPRQRESDPKIVLTEISSLEGGRRRAYSPLYHSRHPYIHAGSPGEKDKDCEKGETNLNSKA